MLRIALLFYVLIYYNNVYGRYRYDVLWTVVLIAMILCVFRTCTILNRIILCYVIYWRCEFLSVCRARVDYCSRVRRRLENSSCSPEIVLWYRSSTTHKRRRQLLNIIHYICTYIFCMLRNIVNKVIFSGTTHFHRLSNTLVVELASLYSNERVINIMRCMQIIVIDCLDK